MFVAHFRRFGVALLALAGTSLGGCATGAVSDHGYSGPIQTKFVACYGYGCRIEKRYPITQTAADRLAAIMEEGKASPEAEREAIRKAVAYVEELSAAAIGARDQAKSPVLATNDKGQMDCIDESTNTRHVMLYLASRGLMSYHTVQDSVTRGALIDGRYPHWTAVVKDQAGKKWAVDSWYEPAGGLPDVMELAYWRSRGVWGER